MSIGRVFITGVGAISPFGVGTQALDEALSSGRSAVVDMRPSWQDQLEDLTCWVGAPLAEPLAAKTIHRKDRRSMGRVSVLSHLACQEALEKAKLSPSDLGQSRSGVAFSSTMGSVTSIEDFFKTCLSNQAVQGVSAGSFFQFMSHTCAANLAHSFGMTGKTISPCAACASSLQAIGEGYETIKAGTEDLMICGGADELHVFVAACFDLVRAASTGFNDQPGHTPRPFDEHRDGIVCAEGAAAIVLESEAHATARGANILGEVLGYATTTDGTHIAQPHSESIERCIRSALDSASLQPSDIEYISAHATGTVDGDRAESHAIREVFGANSVPISSLKGHLGHTLGASGALELVACLGMLNSGYLVPTRNLETPGEGCQGLDHVTSIRQARVRRIMKNSFAFGGVNAVLVVESRLDG